jgi:hypothetical protein
MGMAVKLSATALSRRRRRRYKSFAQFLLLERCRDHRVILILLLDRTLCRSHIRWRRFLHIVLPLGYLLYITRRLFMKTTTILRKQKVGIPFPRFVFDWIERQEARRYVFAERGRRISGKIGKYEAELYALCRVAEVKLERGRLAGV